MKKTGPLLFLSFTGGYTLSLPRFLASHMKSDEEVDNAPALSFSIVFGYRQPPDRRTAKWLDRTLDIYTTPCVRQILVFFKSFFFLFLFRRDV